VGHGPPWADVFPVIGAKDVRVITGSDMLAMLRTVEARGALDVARRLRQHVSQIFLYAIPGPGDP